MSATFTRDECIERILAAVRASSRDEQLKNYLSYIVLAQFNCKKQTSAIIQGSDDKDATLDLVNAAIRETLGEDYQFTSHGFEKAIPEKFRNKEAALVQRIQWFNDFLWEKLRIQSFITSGTLLGMVREGAFLGHDDDIDLAYVSQFTAPEDILAERDAMLEMLNAHHDMAAVVSNGVIKVRLRFEGHHFDFDLFTGYCEGEFVNIYLQRPNSIPKDAILPLKREAFYGEMTNVPQKPEILLEVNYGPGWRTPDRSFRFNLNEHLGFFRFLLPNGGKGVRLEEFDG